MRLSGDKVLHEVLAKSWNFISSSTNFASEIVTEVWMDSNGNRTILYRRYGIQNGVRYTELSEE